MTTQKQSQKTPQQIVADIDQLKRDWMLRNQQMKNDYALLTMVDTLAARGMESYVSNEPQTFYNMAHYLLTKGSISHTVSLPSESPADLDKRALFDSACRYMWSEVDHWRQLGGNQPFIDELGFYMLVTGWISVIVQIDQQTGLMQGQVWSPATVFPRFANNRLSEAVHSYTPSKIEAVTKARQLGWKYNPTGGLEGNINLDDYFFTDDQGQLFNVVLIDGADVTGIVPRPEIKIIVNPVAGFPDRGSLTNNLQDYQKKVGRSIFNVNSNVVLAFNKWKTLLSQTLRDAVQGVTMEFSSTEVATPQQLRERGAFFHYNNGDKGLSRLEPIPIPIEVQAQLQEIRRELQKGFFSDAVYGMMGSESGYSLSTMASSSANQILYPYMDAKHFVISEFDKFFLGNQKTNHKSFQVLGKVVGELKATDIPDPLNVIVESTVATPKDWLERGTITGMLRDTLDEDTIITEILQMSDSQGIKRKRQLDRVLNSPTSQLIQQISSYYFHADYLDSRGDTQQAQLFRKAAQAMEAQFGQPAPGQASNTALQSAQDASKAAGGSQPSNLANPEVLPSQGQGGFSPQQLQQAIGKGSLRANQNPANSRSPIQLKRTNL